MRILCFESGGTKLVAAVADASGKLQTRQVSFRSSGQTAEETIQELVSMGNHLIADDPVQAVGFGFGGTVRRSDQRPLDCFHEDGWSSLDPATTLSSEFGAPVFIENDCNLAALAEARAGFHFLKGTLLYVTLGTGIGAGIVHKGTLLELGDYGEGEIGHCIVDRDGFQCPCGQTGCLETVCSGPGLTNLCNRFGQNWDSKELMKLYREGDPAACRITAAAAEFLAQALANAVNLLSPGLIVLGGGVMQENGMFLELIRQKTVARMFPTFARTQPPSFQLSRLKADVVCRGAAFLALQRLGQLEPF